MSFLLNYGAAIQDPKEEAILSRVHDFNCEWLQRPNIAISEMAQTLRENIPLIRQYRGTVFVPICTGPVTTVRVPQGRLVQT